VTGVTGVELVAAGVVGAGVVATGVVADGVVAADGVGAGVVTAGAAVVAAGVVGLDELPELHVTPFSRTSAGGGVEGPAATKPTDT
jgi:hypothetical protein